MTQELVDETVVARSNGWLSAWVGDEHVMMSAETGTCISLSETGGRVWELLEQPTSVDALCRQLADEYDAEPAAIRVDVLRFLHSLQQQDALKT